MVIPFFVVDDYPFAPTVPGCDINALLIENKGKISYEQSAGCEKKNACK